MFRDWIRLGLGCAASSALAACAPAYPQFGEASYRMEATANPANGGARLNLVVYRAGPEIRVDTEVPGYGMVPVVFDDATQGAYALNPPRRPIYETTTPPPAAPGATSPEALAAPPAVADALPESVGGMAVRIEDSEAPQPIETFWATRERGDVSSTGGCTVANERGTEWRTTDAGGATRSACITKDGIVLRVREEGQVLFEASRLQRGPQDAALFGVPASFHRIDRAPIPREPTAATTAAVEPPPPG